MTAPDGRPPRATIVITTHDRPDFARRAIASALGQTLPDLEVVVVDDGSQPPFDPAADDARVRLVRNEHAGGVCRARNAGLAVARGAWITFLDDDDELVPEMIERSMTAAETSALPAPVAVMSGVMVLDLDGGDGPVLEPPAALRRGEDFCLERKGAAGRAANSLVVPTEVLRGIGGWDPDLEAFQHDDLGLRVNAVASIQGIADPLYRMTTHRAARVSGRTTVIPGDLERTLAKHPEAFARHREAHARYLGMTGYYHLKAGHWGRAIRWAARGVARNPTDLRLWRYLATALVGPYAQAGYRRVFPRDSTASHWTVNRRRARKYLRRAWNYPRAAVGVPLAAATRAVVRGRSSSVGRRREVLLLCVYRSVNAEVVESLVRTARAAGWDVRLWALDRVVPQLADFTTGEGPGAKFPLLNGLVAGMDLRGYDWVVVADDDVVFPHGSIDDVLTVAELAGLDLVQPAHTELSHRENEIAVRRPLSVARRTTFVEIGPVFAVRGRWIPEVVPFPDDHTMGWGLELEWFDLERAGARLGIVDAVALRHLGRVGQGYAKREQLEQLRERVRDRGLDSFTAIQQNRATWSVWQSRPPWEAACDPESSAS